MGNNSTASSPSTSSNPPDSNGSLVATNDGAAASFWAHIFAMGSLDAIITQCHTENETMVWVGIKSFFLVTGLLANAGLMWILLSPKKPLSHSEVLALNLSVLDMLSCFCLPLEIYEHLYIGLLSDQLLSVIDALRMLKMVGCPLLLTFMCVERYLAVARPVAYRQLGKWEYRAAMCACVWVVTLAAALLAYLHGLYSMILYLALSISLLFLLMLLCLVGIVRVLRQSGPGGGSANNGALKRRAMKNVLAVMVPALLAYAPLVLMVPLLAVVQSHLKGDLNPELCQLLCVFLVFPNFGIYIGPTFYLSREMAVTGNLPKKRLRENLNERRELHHQKNTKKIDLNSALIF
ncbi:unnamed protein product [Arctogadus glacialis]